MITRAATLLGTALLLSLPPAHAARARTYADALKRADDGPIIAFCYGANYDKLSQKKYDEFMKSRKVLRGSTSEVYIEIPIYQMPNKKERKARDKIMGGKNLPGGIYSYPSIAIIDRDNTLRAVIQSSEEMKDVDTAREILRDYVDKFKTQQKILKKADGAKGDRIAEMLAEAADIGLTVPSRYTKQLEGVDDKEGFAKQFTFNWEQLLVEMDKQTAHDEAIRYIRGIMAEATYSKEQRQELLAVLTGHLRRGGAPRDMLLALYYEMHAIDPKSMYGSYALEAIRIWLGETPEGDIS